MFLKDAVQYDKVGVVIYRLTVVCNYKSDAERTEIMLSHHTDHIMNVWCLYLFRPLQQNIKRDRSRVSTMDLNI